MADVKVNYDKTFSSKYTREYYRGKSFHFSGHWAPGVHYHNDDYHVDFVVVDNVMLACAKNHTSSQSNKPNNFIIDENGIVTGVESPYWDIVITGKNIAELDVEIFVVNGSTAMRDGERTNLEAHVFRNGKDITDSIVPNYFSWERSSWDIEQDDIWNGNHSGYGNKICITSDDLNGPCTFYCIVCVSDLSLLIN